MSERPIPPGDLAEEMHQLAQRLPKGVGFVMFVIADEGDRYSSGVAASLPPETFAPVLRRWLERYDNGEALNQIGGPS